MKYLIISVLLFISTDIFSQDYIRAFGLRTGVSSGFTYKAFLTEEDAFEGV